MRRADFFTALFLMVLSLYVIFEAWRMPRFEHLKVHPLSAPGIVPAFIALILFLFGTVLLLRSVRNGGHRIKISVESLQRVFNQAGNRRLLLTAILCIGYAGFLIGTIPYWLATSLYIFFFILVFEGERGMNYGRWKRCIISAVLIASGSAIIITFVFERLFLVTLP